ncbi:DNA polymerase delta small subunit-like isoform X2 [Ceratina calcarata]|uniref:DNA polymerase delta small subunit-like isoform X2 n=1 Tax=Ceratina calcarata TaxID=156304 RepID=A0AAJ7SCN5_9HYME|nr:DNA polymerase delta small subunit-like isoform X2 [Ceratina calcarata]
MEIKFVRNCLETCPPSFVSIFIIARTMDTVIQCFQLLIPYYYSLLLPRMEVDPPPVYHREPLEFKSFNKFETCTKSFQQQYCSIYTARLKVLRNSLVQKAKIKWANIEVITLSELSERAEANTCTIIGTLYKHQELKPSILRELSEELQLVTDWCFPGCCPKLSTFNHSERKGKVLIISGLDLANNAQLLSLNLLSEWITGMVGSKEVQDEIASTLCVIIAGNSVRGSVETYDHATYFERKAHDEAIFKKTALVTRKLDDFLLSIVQYCPVILMPGEFDPSCHTLPQQAFHPCILPQCSRFKDFHGVTNPWVGIINSRIVAGSSGQPIKDIMKVAGLADFSPLTWLERTLLWRHYAPTAPDTLPAYPFPEIDPFIITECPDIYFAANMDKYDTGLLTADDGQVVRLICVPKFSETQTGVLVDLHDLKTVPLSFTVA